MNLAIFDFDGTLVSTCDKPLTQTEALAVGWNGKDWWGSACSLRDVTFHENVQAAFRKARNTPQTHVAVLTGRRGIIAWRVRELLRDEGFVGKRMIPHSNTLALKHFHDQLPDEDQALHEEYFTGDYVTEPDYPKGKKGKPVDNTLTHKTFVITNRLMNNKITTIEIWDDRKDHFAAMQTLVRDLLHKWQQLSHAVIHQIFPEVGVDNPYIVDHHFHKTQGRIEESTQDGNKIET